MLVGHKKQWQFLKRSFELNRLSHAYLFAGQKQLGKKTLAKEFIKFVNCQGKDNDSCQTCWSCRFFQKEVHPDLVLIKPEGKEIRISQIRHLQNFISLRPHSSLFKSVILDQADRMNQEAQSCILKSLEEPSQNTLLFLITDSPEALFPTIISRVQKVSFFPVPKHDIEKYLRKQGASPEQAQKISSISFGKPGLSIDLFSDPQRLKNQEQDIKDIIKLSQADLSYRFGYIKNLTIQKKDIKEILENWLQCFRSNMLARTGVSSATAFQEYSLKNYPLEKIKNTLKSLERINFLISGTNVNQKLALEQVMLEL